MTLVVRASPVRKGGEDVKYGSGRRVRTVGLVVASAAFLAACGGSSSPAGDGLVLPSAPVSAPVSAPASDVLPAPASGDPVAPGSVAAPEPVSSDAGGLLPSMAATPTAVPVPSGDAAAAGTSTDVHVTTDPATNVTRYTWGAVTVFQTGEDPPVLQIAKKTKPTVAGVQQRTLVPGKGTTAKTATNQTDVLLVNYAIASLASGKTLASTWENGQAATLRLSAFPSEWATQMSGMAVGERRVFLMPSETAASLKGASFTGAAPGDGVAVVVDLLDVVTVPPVAGASAAPAPAAPSAPAPAAPRPTALMPSPAPRPAGPPAPTVSGTPFASPSGSPSPSATAPASTFAPLPATMFGLHVPWALQTNYSPDSTGEYTTWDGQWPDVNFGSLRLWDTRTTWAMIEPVKGTYVWNTLDGQIAQAKQHSMKDFVLVLGGTPAWAASGAAPDSAPWIGANSASPPLSDTDWVDFVTATATRYHGVVRAYEIWNEPDSPVFWQGTPQQMAHLVSLASKAIKAVDPKAVIVAPGMVTSELVKAKSAKKWWTAMQAEKWPVDVVALHVYPSPKQGVPGFVDNVTQAKTMLASLGWTGPLWVTEGSYRDRAGTPVAAQTARELVARTYWAARDAGVARLYWYAWAPAVAQVTGELLLLQPGNPGASGYQDAYDAGRDAATTTVVNP